MDSEPKVSIIISVFNREKFVGQAIQSVLDQTYKNWELIVIDDGSSDHSWDVICQYEQQLAVHLGQENQGMAGALNRGFSFARGEYITFLSSDDFLMPNGIETLVNFLETHPEIGMVDGDGYVVDETGFLIDQLSKFRYFPEGKTFLDRLLISNYLNVIDTAMHRRIWLEKV